MISKLSIRNLHNSEYYQFLVSANAIFDRHKTDIDRLAPLYRELEQHTTQMELSLTAEKKNEKIRQKNEMDRLRDRLHSRLFSYLKYILYDERDARFNDAQEIMKTLKAIGNPTQLPENAQSAMMTTIGNRLEPLRDKLESTGALQTVEDMLEANRQFIILEQEARDITASHKLENVPSAGNVRKQADETYRCITDAINAYAKLPHEKETYRELATDMNVLIDKYSALITARKRAAITGKPEEGGEKTEEGGVKIEEIRK